MAAAPKGHSAMGVAVLVSLMLHASMAVLVAWHHQGEDEQSPPPLPLLFAQLGSASTTAGSEQMRYVAGAPTLSDTAPSLSPRSLSTRDSGSSRAAATSSPPAPLNSASNTIDVNNVGEAAPTDATEDRFWSPDSLDRPAMPVSAPDPSFLKDKLVENLQFRLRLFINAAGEAVRVQVMEPAGNSVESDEAIRDMFLATRFIPAIRSGKPVSSYLDIHVDVSDWSLATP